MVLRSTDMVLCAANVLLHTADMVLSTTDVMLNAARVSDVPTAEMLTPAAVVVPTAATNVVPTAAANVVPTAAAHMMTATTTHVATAVMSTATTTMSVTRLDEGLRNQRGTDGHYDTEPDTAKHGRNLSGEHEQFTHPHFYCESARMTTTVLPSKTHFFRVSSEAVVST